jgi:hypothetical protein
MNAIFMVAALVVSGAVLSPSPTPCDRISKDALKHLEARTSYEKLGGQPCAAAELKKLDEAWSKAREDFEKAKKFEKSNPGEEGEARRKYLDILQIEPAFADAANALAFLGRADQTDAFAGAQSLADNGFWTDALASIKNVLAAGHKLQPGRLSDILRPSFLMRVNHWLEENAVTLLKFIIPLVIVLLIRQFFRPSIEISDFKDDPVSLKIGKNLAAMTRERLKRFQTTYEPRLGLLNGPRQAFALPADISKALPPTLSWLSIIPSLLAFLTPRAALTIEGCLHPPSVTQGAGLTLTMTRAGELLHTSTLWQSDFNTKVLPAKDTDPSGFYDLAEPAAIWMLFRISEEVKA